MSDKTILEQWRAIAYDQQADRNKLQQFWAKYFNIEKNTNLIFFPKFSCRFSIKFILFFCNICIKSQ